MTVLRLYTNELEELNLKAVVNVTQVKKLSLENNKIKQLSAFLDLNILTIFPNLQVLNLSYNELYSIEAHNFIGLPMLHRLSLANNNINSIDQAAFEGLVNLYNLELNNNNLHGLPDFLFSPLLSLHHLDLSETGLLSAILSKEGKDAIVSHRRFNIKSFINISLEELRLNGNDFQMLTDFEQPLISGFHYTKKMTLNHNKAEVLWSMLDNLNFLEELELQHARNIVFYNNTFTHSSLISLNLRGSEILEIATACFENAKFLKVLDISNIHFVQVFDFDGPPLKFRNLVKLEKLVLSNHLNDKVIELNEDTFRNSSQIKYLYLRNIGAKTVTYTSLPRLLWSNLHELDLSNNPYVCDCELVWFQRWLSQTKNTSTKVVGLDDPTAYRCSYPVEEAGKSIIGLDGRMPKLNALTCFELPPDWYLIVLILFVNATSLLSVLVSIIHRYRWHVRYWQFAIQVIICKCLHCFFH